MYNKNSKQALASYIKNLSEVFMMILQTSPKESFDFSIIRENLYCTVDGVRINSDKDAIVRTDTLEPIGYVSKQDKNYYNLVYHTELVENVRAALADMEIQTRESTKLTKNGARLYHTIDFPDVKIEPVVGDFVNMRVIVRNSYDGSGKVGFELGGNRLICSNGMRAYKKAFFMLQKHSAQFLMDEVIEKFKNAVDTFQLEVAGFYKVLGNTPMEKMRGLAIIKHLIESKQIPERYGEAVGLIWLHPENSNEIISEINKEYTPALLTSEYDTARNLWTFYNAFTLILTHCVKSLERSRAMHDAIQNKLRTLI